MAKARIEVDTDKKITPKTQSVSVGGRDISVPVNNQPKTVKPKVQTVSVGGREVSKTPAANNVKRASVQAEKSKVTNFVNKAKSYTPEEKTVRTSPANPYKKTYTEDDYNSLKNTLMTSAEDPYYTALWENVDYKGLWSDEDKQKFDAYNNYMNELGTETTVAKGSVGAYKKEADTKGDNEITDIATFDETGKGTWIDFTKEIADNEQNISDLKKREAELENLVRYADTPETRAEYERYKLELDDTKNRIDEATQKGQALQSKKDYQNAVAERIAFEDLRENGTKDEFVEYAKYTGAYLNNTLEDIALNFESNQFRKIAGIQTFIDVVKRDYSDAEARRASDTAKKLFSTGDITEDELNEVLNLAQEVLDRNAKPLESVGLQLNDVADQLSEMQMNGESASKKLFVNVVGNVLDNISGQFAPSLAFGRVGMQLGTAAMSFSSYASTYQRDIEKGFTHEQAVMDASLQTGIEWLTELIGGERILRYAEGDILPRTFGMLVKEGIKSGTAETVEEGMGWLASPLATALATGQTPSFKDWDKAELKEAVTTAFLAGFLQSEVMADYSDFGSKAPLNSAERYFADFFTIETYEQKQDLQDLLPELQQMENEAGIRKTLQLPDGTKISEKQFANMVKRMAERGIERYEARSQVKGVELINANRENTFANFANEWRDSIKEATEVQRQDHINSLMESLSAGQAIQTINQKMEEVVQSRMIQENSERLAQIEEGLKAEGINAKATVWENLNDKARSNARVISRVSEVIGGTPVEFADLRGKNGKIIDGVYLDGRVVVNPNAELGAISTLVHEYTHGLESSKYYNVLRNEVRALYGVNYLNAIRAIQENYSEVKELSFPDAEKELVANTVQKLFGNEDFVKRLVKYNTNMAYKMYTDLKAASVYSTIAEEMAQTFMRGFSTSNLTDKQIEEIQKKEEAQGTPEFSIGSVFQAIGMNIEKRANSVIAKIGGKQIDSVSIADIHNSPLGRLMDLSVKKEFISQEEADEQMKMYGDICNLILNTNDPDMVWAISGSLGYQKATEADNAYMDETKSTKSSAFTSNSDKQYKRTFDVTTICNKTQQVIDVMSQTMLKLGRGLTESEVVEIVYDEVNKAGEPVPCPVCYVFSRWVGIGGLLNNINNYQAEYENADLNRLRAVQKELTGQIDEIAEREHLADKKSKARDKLSKALTKEYNNLCSKQSLAELNGEALSESELERLNTLEEYIKVLDRWTWIKDVRLSKNYKPVPPNVLFDLNKGEQFANEYPETWKFRTTRGPAMGKAITPYVSEVLGQTILGFASSDMKGLGEKRGSNKNPFLKDTITKTMMNKLNGAIKNAAVQNLLGGSRAQSTSDFRFEYVLDYLLHFMQLQSIHSYGQTYTKAPEAVTMLASVGYEVNMSLMPKGYGWEQVQEGAEDAIMLSDGKWYRLVFSDVTGMNAKDAFRLAKEFDSAQPIMVGINDTHIRLCMKDDRITFIIPYHASGSSEGRYLAMMREVGEKVPADARTDYSKVQNDVVNENATPKQKELRKIREAILTGKANSLSKDEMTSMKEHPLLNSLYERFYTKGVDTECFGNFLNKKQASQIFPFEYWDKTTTFETADRNGDIFVNYCKDLGITPRFEQFSTESGYWKMLIDRAMYNVDGSYHYQEAINLDDFNTNFLLKDKMTEGIVQPSKQMDKTKTEGITNEVLKRIQETDFPSKSNAQLSYTGAMGMTRLQEYIENDPNSRFKDVYENMQRRWEQANDMMVELNEDGARKYTNDEIYEKTGWLFSQEDSQLKGEFYDDESINRIYEWAEAQRGKSRYFEDDSTNTKLRDIIGEDSLLFVMYPKLADTYVFVSNTASTTWGSMRSTLPDVNGYMRGDAKRIRIGRFTPDGYEYVRDPNGRYRTRIDGEWVTVSKKQKKRHLTEAEIKDTIAHEIQHVIQLYEGFYYGDRRTTQYRDLPGEKESFKVGSMQADESLRNVDVNGNMLSDDGRQDTNIPEGTDTGDVEADESTESVDDFEQTGELENGDEQPEQEDSEGSSEADTQEVTPEESSENLTDNIDDDTDDEETEKVARILRGGPEQRKSSWNDVKRWLKHHIGDHLDGVEDLSRDTKNGEIMNKADFAMNYRSFANNAILDARYKLRGTEKIGESLSHTFSRIAENDREDFDLYMYHYRNLDTTSLASRLGPEYMAGKYLERHPVTGQDGKRITPEQLVETISNLERTLDEKELKRNPLYRDYTKFIEPKYVFGSKTIGYEQSQQAIKELEEKHPEFKKLAEEIWEYARQDLQILLDEGVISKETYEMFQNETPHYVPIARNVDAKQFEGKYRLDPNKAIRRFKGSNRDMWSLEYALINHTYNVYKTALTNSLHKEIYTTLKQNVSPEGLDIESVDDIVDGGHEMVGTTDNKTFRMFAYVDGVRRVANIEKELYDSLRPRRVDAPDLPGISTINDIRRNLITSWNPVFALLNNPIKDLQDAGYNTKYKLSTYYKNYARAWAQITRNGEIKKLYMRNGGGENSYLNEASRKEAKWKPLRNLLEFGEAIEMAPRLAEFISSIEAGNSIEQAMYEAAEVTTNFKRGGDIAKYINRNGAAFFNASIQGFEKQIRNYKDARDGGAKAMATYMAKVALLSGVPLLLLNGLVWKDDKDYEELSEYIKQNYYIVGKVGDRFIRIPKGRLSAFYQTVMTNGIKTVKRQKDVWDALMDTLQSGIDNVAPNNPIDNLLVAPLIQAFGSEAGKTWYGEDLVPSRLQKYPDEEQFDASIDKISVWLGGKLKVSPYKINYVLDQYSGGIGDIGLPMLTLQANNGIDNKILASIAAPWLDRFTTDPVMKNENVSAFYTLSKELEKKKNSRNATDEQQLSYKYLNTVATEMSGLYKLQREIQADPNLSNGEKYAKVRELKEKINAAAREALNNYDAIDINTSYADVGGVKYHLDANGAWKKMTEDAVKKMSGLSEEQQGQYYSNYYKVQNARDEVKKNTPKGQNADYRQVTTDMIRNSDMDAQTKNHMFDSYYSGKFTDAVNGMDVDDDMKLEIKIAKTMADGRKDENGKTISNSKAQAVADAYNDLGVLNDVLKYIKDNDIAPSVMGLSKTVYNKLIKSSDYQEAYNSTVGKKSSSKKSSGKKSSKKTVKKIAKAPSGGGGSIRLSQAPNVANIKTDTKKVASGYLKAYASTFNRNRGSVSNQTSSTTVCPRCHNRVPAGSNRCPVCGTRLG